jgi:hypothetical protein
MAGRRSNPLDTTLHPSDSESEEDQQEQEDTLPGLEERFSFEPVGASDEEEVIFEPDSDDEEVIITDETVTVTDDLLLSGHGDRVNVPLVIQAGLGAAGILTMATAPPEGMMDLTNARSDFEAAGMAVAVPRAERTKLSADALLKLQRASTKGMSNKFFLMGNSKEDQLVQCYNLTLRVEELKHSMQKSDIIGAFDIYVVIIPSPVTAYPSPMPATVSLFDKKGEDLKEEFVRATIKFKRYHGLSYAIQDLQ